MIYCLNKKVIENEEIHINSDLDYSSVPTNNIGKLKLFLTKLSDFSGKDVFAMLTTQDKLVYGKAFGGTIAKYTIPATPATAIILNTPQDVSLPAGQFKVFKFTPTATKTYEILTSPYAGTGANNDTYLELFSDEALTKRITYDDNGAGNTFSKISTSLTAGTTYYIKLRHYNTTTALNARITITAKNSLITIETPIDIDSPSGQNEICEFTPTDTTDYEITTRPFSGNSAVYDTYLEIYLDANLTNKLAYNDDYYIKGSQITRFSKIKINLTKDIKYYIKVRQYSNSAFKARLTVEGDIHLYEADELLGNWEPVYGVERNTNYETLLQSSSYDNPTQIAAVDTFATVNTKYQIYTTGGTTYLAPFNSIFEAINKIPATGYYILETDTKTRVFEKTASHRYYYVFQKSNLIATYDAINDTVANPVEKNKAIACAKKYQYSHVISSYRNIVYNSSQNYISYPGIEAEPESGAYYYKFSKTNISYGTSMRVDLKQSKMKFTSNNYKHGKNIAIAYEAAMVDNIPYEVGVMCADEGGQAWKIYKNEWSTEKNKMVVMSEPITIVANTQMKSDGYLTADNDVFISIIIPEGRNAIMGYVRNTSGTVDHRFELKLKPSHHTFSKIYFLQAMSFIPTIDNMTEIKTEKYLSELKNGAELKNISIWDCKLYQYRSASGKVSEFYSDTPGVTFMSFLYNDEYGVYNLSGTGNNKKETVDIVYR